AVGDLDGDGFPEIVAVSDSRTLIAFRHDGTLLWKSAVRLPDSRVFGATYEWGSASLADLDHNGTPEIVFGPLVFNSDGSLRWDGRASGGQGSADNFVGPLSLVADIDLDGSPEVIAGNSAYRANGSLLWNAPIPDGFPAVADFDGDGYPEIVVVASGA